MTTLRITADLREDIVGRAMSDIFGPKSDALDLVEHKLADEARVAVYGAELLGRVEAIPREWFHSTHRISYNVGGFTIILEHSMIMRYPERAKFDNHKPYIKDDALRQRVKDHADARERLKTERKAAREALDTLIRNCRTLKKLTEMWPEGHAYFKHLEGVSNKTPTVRADAVNAMLGLPKGDK